MLLGNEVPVVQHTTLYFHDLILLNRWKEYGRVPNSAGAGQAGCTGSPALGNLVRVWEKGVWGPLSSVFLAAKGLA